MPGSTPSNHVASLAEEFVERYRTGERPSIAEYVDRFPELAGEIRDIFPAVAMMENIALGRESLDGRGPTSGPITISQVGDFRIVREVGRGGMGVVYEAEQMSLGRFVALKLLPGQVAATAQQKERFLREARAAAKLHHTNIVPVFGFGEADHIPYYAMQFIIGQGVDAVIDELRAQFEGRAKGGTLVTDITQSLCAGTYDFPAERVGVTPRGPAGKQSLSGESTKTNRGPLWQGIARLGVQVAGAIAHAHQLGVLHRDVKPSNLLLDVHGTAWVTDFGLAKTEGQPDLTGTGDVLGTLRYLPPESLDGNADARGDIYAIGLTLYELLALRPAFDAPDRAALLRQVMTASPPPLRKLIPALPRDLTTIVQKAIQKDPDRRYQTATALADDLQRFLDNRPIAARPVSVVGHFWRACKRNKLASSMAAVAILAVFIGANGAVWGWKAALDSADKLREERDEVRSLNAVSAERLYVADMNRAQLSWYGGNVSLVRELLAAQNPIASGPDRRGIEWYYLNRLVNATTLVIPTKVRRFPILLISPAGDKIVMATGAGVEAWRADGQPLWTYDGADKSLFWYCACFSPTGDRLVCTDIEGKVHVLRVLDAATGVLLRTVPGVRDDTVVAFSPKGDVVIGATADGPVRIWDAVTWAEREPLLGHQKDVRHASFTPDGNRLVTIGVGKGKGGEMRVWDTRKTPWELVGHTQDEVGTPDSLALRADGGWAVGCSAGEVRAWNLSATPPQLVWRRQCGGQRVAYHPDGTRVFVACNDSVVRVLDPATGSDLDPLRGHENTVEAVAVAQDGTWAASAGRDRTIRIWPLPIVPVSRRFDALSGNIHSAAMRPDGAELVTVAVKNNYSIVHRWDAKSGALIGILARLSGNVHRVRYSPDGRWLACAGQNGVLTCWATDALDAPAWAVKAHVGWLGAKDIDFDRAGRHFASVGWDRKLKIIEVATGTVVREIALPSPVTWNVCFHPEGKQVAVVCDLHNIENHSSIIVYDAETGRKVFQLSDAKVSHAVPRFSPDGKILYATRDGVDVGSWTSDTGRPLAITFKGHTGWVHSIDLSQDGSRLLTASRDGTARLWDTSVGHELLALRGHARVVNEASFTPDGGGVLTVGDDGTARIWDAPRE